MAQLNSVKKLALAKQGGIGAQVSTCTTAVRFKVIVPVTCTPFFTMGVNTCTKYCPGAKHL